MVDFEDQQRVTAKLVLVEGTEGHPSQPILLREKDVVIGRGNGCDVTWSSLQISRRHATLEFINQKWFIRDCSTNGLSVGNEKLSKGIVRELKHKELIHFIPTGALVYRFESTDPPPLLTGIKTEPPLLTVDDDLSALLVSDDNSNHSESLLSLNGQVDDLDFFGAPAVNEITDFPSPLPPEPVLAPVQELQPHRDTRDRDRLITTGKRKTPSVQTSDAELDGQLDRKRKRDWDSIIHAFMKDEEIPESLTGSSESLLACLSPRNTNDSQLEDSIENCIDVEALQKKCVSLYQKFKLVEAENQTLRMEKSIEQEESRRKQNDAQSRSEAHKEELFKQIVEVLEQEFACCICNEIFIQPTVVDCGHTFCGFCIGEWNRKKPECPICRKHIRNPTKHVEMDNFLQKIHTLLSSEIRTKRDQAICERVEAKEKAAIRAISESRGRRNGVPNGDFFGFPADRLVDRLPIPFDLLAELQSINDHPWPPPPAHSTNNANNNGSRRSERIRGRTNNPNGTTHRGRGRYPRQPGMDILGIHGGNRHVAVDDSILQLPTFETGQQQQQGGSGEPQPGSSRGSMYNLLIGGNAGVQVPDFRGNHMARGNYFPMFPFGAGMGRPDEASLGQQVRHHRAGGPPTITNTVQQHPNSNTGLGMLDVLLVE